MTLRTRLDRLERAHPGAGNALDELLASVATQGLRIHERPAGMATSPPVDPQALAAWLDALSRTPASPLHTPEIQR
jgi:hypothetical protein